ncbi:Holliday junction branch migration DNA helicase RuvB [Vibrio parahaemolyticus]|uniref:Holliday junction branch migration complex subunit RuvB n=1 Tax=Vibrio parahaemolyticus TaxID=670 RepID=A0AAW8PZY6_VIBPH|nr:Holliday junction branch migration DNA helicase RuvB [Vibrio parahaemolyticus]EGR2229506.1 Holliday junction branch migration DNA helicase RuvB [Vibrio parahaemolyticus]MDS1820904.1 Holliday junction branch migration DNA helicase RuvB [Vibrio parahaemolyticus]
MAKSLRPENFDEYIGQKNTIDQLKTYVLATKIRAARDPDDCALPHVVFEGGAGLGKTSIANVTAKELGTNIRIMQGNSIEKLADLAQNLVVLEAGDILFIDEIHSLRPFIEEMLYSVMEDYRLDIMIDDGAGGSKPVNINLPQFTLMGATTEIGRLKKPFRERFQYEFTMSQYTEDELALILKLNVGKMYCQFDSDEPAKKIAKASRGVPRVALTHLRKCCDWALVENDGVINLNIVDKAFELASISEEGLSANDIKYLTALASRTRPTGLKNLAEITSIDKATIENSIEPYLHEQGYIEKLPNGRIITQLGEMTLNAETGI